MSPASPVLQVDSLPAEQLGKPSISAHVFKNTVDIFKCTLVLSTFWLLYNHQSV